MQVLEREEALIKLQADFASYTATHRHPPSSSEDCEDIKKVGELLLICAWWDWVKLGLILGFPAFLYFYILFHISVTLVSPATRTLYIIHAKPPGSVSGMIRFWK